MRRALSAAAVFLVASLVPAGCGSGGGGGGAEAPSGPTLVLVDSVRLARPDSVYIGKPAQPSVDPRDGSFYVPDIFSKTVYRFGRDGRLLSTYGQPGQGPGEFQWPGAVFSPDDSTVAVLATHHHRLSFFDRSTGDHRRDWRLPGMPTMDVPLIRGDTVWMSMMRPGTPKGLVRFEGAGDTARWIGRLPSPLQASLREEGRYARIYSWAGYLAEHGGHILEGFKPLNWIYVRDRSGDILDSVYVPEARRRGVPANLRRKVDGGEIGPLDAHEATSALFDLHALPDGRIAVEHQDWRLLDREVVPPPAAATVWVSLLSADLERACVDARLSDSDDAKPATTYRGDTIFQLERRIVPREADRADGDPPVSGGRMEAWLRIARIDPSGCDWVPARPPTGGS